jgi:hypothetical protein
MLGVILMAVRERLNQVPPNAVFAECHTYKANEQAVASKLPQSTESTSVSSHASATASYSDTQDLARPGLPSLQSSTTIANYSVISGDLLSATEQYIVHQCNCISTYAKGSTNVVLLEWFALIFNSFFFVFILCQITICCSLNLGLSDVVFRKFPYAQCYTTRKQSGREDSPGTIQVTGIDIGKRGVINLFGQRKPGNPRGADDDSAARVRYFRSGLDAIAAIPNLQSVAFPHMYVDSGASSLCVHTYACHQSSWFVFSGRSISAVNS